jgi:hypothetical protein
VQKHAQWVIEHMDEINNAIRASTPRRIESDGFAMDVDPRVQALIHAL